MQGCAEQAHGKAFQADEVGTITGTLPKYQVDERHAPMVARMGCQLVEAIQLGNPLLFSTLLHELVQFVQVQDRPVSSEEFSVPELEIPTPEWLFPVFTG